MSDGNHASMASVRAKLRELSSTVQERRGEMTSVNSCGISEVIQEANAMHDRTAQDTRASALDANLISLTASLGAEQAGNLEKVNPESWVKALGAAYGVGSVGRAGGGVVRINWKRLGEEVRDAGIFVMVPGVTFLLSSYDGPVEKKQRERKQKDRTPSEPLQTAESVSVNVLKEGAEDKAQVARIKTMRAVIEKHTDFVLRPKGINLFKIVLNPTSFSETVENLFDLAFLTKDGRVSVRTIDGCPYVGGAVAPTTEDYEKGAIRKQNILSIDMKTYRKLVDRWCEGPPLLPARSESAGNSDESPAKRARHAE